MIESAPVADFRRYAGDCVVHYADMELEGDILSAFRHMVEDVAVRWFVRICIRHRKDRTPAKHLHAALWEDVGLGRHVLDVARLTGRGRAAVIDSYRGIIHMVYAHPGMLESLEDYRHEWPEKGRG